MEDLLPYIVAAGIIAYVASGLFRTARVTLGEGPRKLTDRKSTDPVISFDSENFKITRNNGRVFSMRWADLTKVHFEQHDYTIDVIYYFFGDANGNWVNFNEFAQGKKEFLAAVNDRWPGYSEVAERFGQLAWGRYDTMPNLTLLLVEGERLVIPDEWAKDMPPVVKHTPIWQVWKWFS